MDNAGSRRLRSRPSFALSSDVCSIHDWRSVMALVPGPTNMFQIKRFVALVCVGLHLVSTGCSSASYGGNAERAAYPMDGAVATAAAPPPVDPVSTTRSFESVVSSAPGAMAADELWSGGETGDSFKKEAPLREEAPPPPPPEFVGQQVSANGPKPAEQKPPTGNTTPSTTGKKDEPQRVEVASSQHAPMLIYIANVQMAVYEVRNSLGEVESLARSLGGFLAKRNDRSITIRVPAATFEDALRRIEKLGDMIARDVAVEDVTEEFNDVEIRLKNARAVRERLEQLLSKAAKVEESIQIEKELERVALLIERLEGRMKFLKDRAAYSTITVTFQPRSAAELGKRPFNLPVPWLYEMGLGRLLAL